MLPYILDKIKIGWEIGRTTAWWSAIVFRIQKSSQVLIIVNWTIKYFSFRNYASELSEVEFLHLQECGRLLQKRRPLAAVFDINS